MARVPRCHVSGGAHGHGARGAHVGQAGRGRHGGADSGRGGAVHGAGAGQALRLQPRCRAGHHHGAHGGGARWQALRG